MLTTEPNVTILIPTYARTRLLSEAISSALAQDYKGTFSVMVLNDCQRQFLTCRDYRVTCVNRTDRFPTLGAKRNQMLLLGSTPWVVWLDDDDLLMPWHLSSLVRAIQPGQDRDVIRAVLCRTLIRYQHQRWSWGDALGGINGIMVHTEFANAVGRFDRALDVGEDNDFRSKMLTRPHAVAYSPVPSYVYRVDAPVMHISQSLRGTTVDSSMFVNSANKRMDDGREPTGEINIVPAMENDYEAIFRHQFPGDAP